MRRTESVLRTGSALLLSACFALLTTSCARKGVQEEVTVEGRVSTDHGILRAAGPVDVLVLPVQNEVGELLPAELIELEVRQILLSKRYSVLSRDLAFAKADEIIAEANPRTPSWRDNVPGAQPAEASGNERGVALARAWRPGFAAEDAFFRVVVHSFRIPEAGPIRQLEIDADFQLIGAAKEHAGKVLWSYQGAHAIIPVDQIGDRMRSRQENLRRVLSWYVQSILEHLPESEGLQAGSGANPLS
ncbi:MAG: hypothetical protein IPN34_25575 [Planctomycetes bacterium]|nr:hypothetical protein [Planctomycetota bacterium]